MDDDVAMTGDGRLVPPDGLPDPALPLVPTNAALDHRPTDHDAQTRRVGGPVGLRRPLASDRRKSPRGGSWRRFLSRRPPDADVQLAATNRLPLGKRPAELSSATVSCADKHCRNAAVIYGLSDYRRRRRRTARPPRVRIRRKNPWRRFFFLIEIGRRVRFMWVNYTNRRGARQERKILLSFSEPRAILRATVRQVNTTPARCEYVDNL